jgi:hypothetical protein
VIEEIGIHIAEVVVLICGAIVFAASADIFLDVRRGRRQARLNPTAKDLSIQLEEQNARPSRLAA